MAGLFDYQDPESVGRMMFAAGLLEAGGPSKMPISTGQALAQGLRARQKGATDAATELRRNALTDAQIEKFRSEASYREFLKSKGIDPELPKDVQSAMMYFKMTPEERKLALEWKRGDSQIIDLNGVKQRVSTSGYGGPPSPLTDIQSEADARAYIAAMVERAKAEQTAALDPTNSWDPVNRRYVRTSRLESLPPHPMPTPPVPRPMPPVGPQPAPTSPRPVQMTPTGDIAPPEGLSPEQLKAWFANQAGPPPQPAAAQQPAPTPQPNLAPKEQAELDAAATAKISAMKNSVNQFKVAIDSLRKGKENVGLLSSGVVGGVTRWIPGSPGYELEKLLDPAKANTALEALKQMRFESKTGAAMGNVALGEMLILMSRLGSLDTGLRGSKLKTEIDSIKVQYEKAIEAYEKAITAEEAYLKGGQSSAPASGGSSGGTVVDFGSLPTRGR
jgi:hypothetical protein